MKNEIGLEMILMSILGLCLTGCGVSKPQVEDKSYAMIAFQHVSNPTSCLNCHSADRPLPSNGFSHYNNEDCVQCHLPGGNWNQHSFAHSPAPNTCNQCHEKDRKLPVGGALHGNGSDCVTCHSSHQSWSQVAFNHSPLPASCLSCHSSDRPTTSTHPSISNPAVTDKSHFAAKDCFACHAPGTSNTPAAFQFSHRNAQGNDVSFCLPCHYTQGKSQHGSSNYFSGDGSCYNCHRTRRSWGRN